GAGEVDDLEALGGDRVGGDHAVDGAVLDHGLAGLDGGVDVVDLLLAALAEDASGQPQGEPGVEDGGLDAGGGGAGEHRVGARAAADELVALLDAGGPGARGDGVLGGERAGGDHVGEGGALAALVPAAEVGALAGVGGAGGQADQGQGGGCGDDGATPG